MEQPSNNKTKIVTAIVIVAAIAIIYFVTAARTSTGDASSMTSDTTPSTSASTTANNSNNDSSNTSSDASFKDGSYSASGSYRTPQSVETINVTLTVKSGFVTDSSVQQSPQTRDAVPYQAAFKDNYKSLVIGKKLSDLSLTNVSGSSLTPLGFNTAVDKIKSEAAN